MEPREAVRLRLRERACARVKLFVLGKGDDYLHISIPPSTRTRKTGGRQLHCKQGAKINISVSRFCLSPASAASLLRPAQIFSEGGRLIFRTHPPFVHPFPCPGGDSRLVDCPKSSSLPPPPSIHLYAPIPPSLPPHYSSAAARFIHSLCVTNMETVDSKSILQRARGELGLSGAWRMERGQNENTCVKQARNLPRVSFDSAAGTARVGRSQSVGR